LREIGCRAFVLIETHNPKAFAHSIECVLIGYTPNCKAYRCWQRSSGKIFNSGNVRFIEFAQMEEVHFNKDRIAERLAHPPAATDAAANGVPDDQSSPDPTMTTSTLPTVDNPVEFVDPPPQTPTQAIPAPQTIPGVTEAAAPVPEPPASILPPPAPPLRRPNRVPKKPFAHLAADAHVDDDGEMEILEGIEEAIAASPEDDDGVETALLEKLSAYLADNPINVEFPDDPRNYREAMAAPDAEQWIVGTHEELKALKDLGVYELVPPTDVPRNKTILGFKPVYIRKRNELSIVVRNKVRYCVLGCRQKYSRDYEQTTSPTARLESFRAVLHITASRGWDIQQVDVKTAFLNATLPPDEIQYSRQPKHFEEPARRGGCGRL
jgi:hypothetical protein